MAALASTQCFAGFTATFTAWSKPHFTPSANGSSDVNGTFSQTATATGGATGVASLVTTTTINNRMLQLTPGCSLAANHFLTLSESNANYPGTSMYVSVRLKVSRKVSTTLNYQNTGSQPGTIVKSLTSVNTTGKTLLKVERNNTNLMGQSNATVEIGPDEYTTDLQVLVQKSGNTWSGVVDLARRINVNMINTSTTKGVYGCWITETHRADCTISVVSITPA